MSTIEFDFYGCRVSGKDSSGIDEAGYIVINDKGAVAHDFVFGGKCPIEDFQSLLNEWLRNRIK